MSTTAAAAAAAAAAAEICILGAGATGLCLLLLLEDAGADLSKVTIIDPFFDGGDLVRRWTSVLSNTPWSKTLGALKATLPSLAERIAEEEGRLGGAPVLEDSSSLAALAGLLRRLAAGALRRVVKIQGVATRARYSDTDAQWLIDVDGYTHPIKGRRLVLATGSEPKALDLGIPAIPLEVGLDAGRLPYYVSAGQRVLVFGTAHSGTLVIRNLLGALGPRGRVTVFYATPEPFYWARDGHYDGIKREAADTADSIQRGDYASQLELVPITDTARVIRASKGADWVVFAMGFQARKGIALVKGGEAGALAPPFEYDGATGVLAGLPAAWGFGIAYPNRAPDGVHWDVSVAAFLDHMKRQLPSLMAGFVSPIRPQMLRRR